jgi:putative oxygen-independent coproporphyrinogen III oxidase
MSSASAVTIAGPSSSRDTSIRLSALPPLSIYAHFPWCVSKCPYCDFNSHALRGDLPEQSYLAALIVDLEAALPQIWGRRVGSIFLGGGTPSLFSPVALNDFLAAVRARVALVPDAEITLEANPGTFEAVKFAEFRAIGINRLSVGIQSFNPIHLKALGRIHDDAQAHAAVNIALAHFDNVNLDLMYALPSQSLDQALADVDQAIAYGVPHVSAYHLTLEPNTLFHRLPPPLPDEDTAANMQEAIEGRLTVAGYEHYETSAFAKPGHLCRHNLNYWQFGDYLGIGAGAHGKLSFSDRVVRQMRHKHPAAYMESLVGGSALQEEHAVPARDLPFEFMMNTLRLVEGFSVASYSERTGLPFAALMAALDEAQRRGLIERDHVTIRPTQRGQRFLNDLLQIFMPD